MAHAFVAQVELESGADPDVQQQMLTQGLIPLAKSQPGFQRGVWVRSADHTTGIGIIVFDTEDNAKAASETLAVNRPPDAPTITSSGIYEVVAQA